MSYPIIYKISNNLFIPNTKVCPVNPQCKTALLIERIFNAKLKKTETVSVLLPKSDCTAEITMEYCNRGDGMNDTIRTKYKYINITICITTRYLSKTQPFYFKNCLDVHYK